jgi:hypothetical protein
MPKSKLNERLLVPASDESWNASKEGGQEVEQMQHSEAHSARGLGSMRD